MLVDVEVDNRVRKYIAEQKISAMRLWDEIKTAGGIVSSYEDTVARPLFVNLQAYIELTFAELLEEGKIKSAVGIIHTPLPATPLCTAGEISAGLVPEEILKDPERLATVLKRPNILRKYLNAGGVLVTAYSNSKRQERSLEQLAILESLKTQYPNNLLDCPLTSEITDEFTGATYFITDNFGKLSVFSIQAYQANKISPGAQPWGLWYGPSEKPEMIKRVEKMMPFFKEHNLMPDEILENISGAADVCRHRPS